MPVLDKEKRPCGFLEIERRNGSDIFYRHFFLLNSDAARLEYYSDEVENLPDGMPPEGSINLQYVSKVTDASNKRTKVDNCIGLTIAGKEKYLKADTYEELEEWVEILNNACKIIVPKPEHTGGSSRSSSSSSSSGSNSNSNSLKAGQRFSISGSYYNDAVGGFSQTNSMEFRESSDSSSDDSGKKAKYVVTHLNPLKVGFCVKQGLLRKSWKRRFFVLDDNGIAYYKNDTNWQNKDPIRHIPKESIHDAKVSRGTHEGRDNLFELVTPQRVFYIQCDSPTDMHAWIAIIRTLIPSQEIAYDAKSDSVQISPNLLKAKESMWL